MSDPLPKGTFSFDHVHVICEDINVLSAFLCDVIGAEEVSRGEQFDNWVFSLQGVRILARQRRPKEELQPGEVRRAGLDHIGFQVDDVDKTVRALEGKGCTLTRAPVQILPDLRIAFLLAPGGLLIEVLKRGVPAGS